MSRLRLTAGLLTALTLSAAPALAQAEEPAVPATKATIAPALSPAKPGAIASFKFAIKFAGGEFGVPPQVTRVVVHMPAGLRFALRGLKSCSKARLLAHGVKGCPAASRIGRGHALVEVHAGASNVPEEAEVWAFAGPPHHGIPSILLLGQGETPLEESVVISGTWQPDSGQFGERLVFSIPPIPTVPLEPTASTISLSVKIGVKRRGRTTVGVVLPRHCPSGRLPFAADFSFADGTSTRSTATVRCR